MGREHRHHKQVSVIPIATPLAGHRLTKKIGELITKMAEEKKLVYGIKDTAKVLKKKENVGLTVLGGNVSPMDVITHIPGMCDADNKPYVFLPTKEQISAYAQRTSPVACVHIPVPENEEEKAAYDGILEEIHALSESA